MPDMGFAIWIILVEMIGSGAVAVAGTNDAERGDYSGGTSTTMGIEGGNGSEGAINDEYPETKGCRRQFPMFQSTVAVTSNRLLWGDWDKGEYGLLARSVDLYDQPPQKVKEVYALYELDEVPALHYLPAVYLHASLRMPKAIFEESPDNSFALLVGTKYAKNTAFKAAQGTRGGVVDCENYYPTDAGTILRGVLEQPGATFCRSGRLTPSCVNGQCLTAESDSACGQCLIPGAKFGDHMGRWSESNNEKIGGLTYRSCWYDKSREGLKEMIAASNSLWVERHRWHDRERFTYDGWAECPVTKNIQQNEMVDAIAIPLYRMGETSDPSLCEYSNHDFIYQRLKLAYEKGYGELPILFYRETPGMKKASDCERMWGGTNCENGYAKHFFSQEYRFGNGACIHRPAGCNETYYFPPANTSTPEEVMCSAFTEESTARIESLRRCESGIECSWGVPNRLYARGELAVMSYYAMPFYTNQGWLCLIAAVTVGVRISLRKKKKRTGRHAR